MNAIGQIHFDLTAEYESFARKLYAGWDRFFSGTIERITDELLVRFDHPDEHIVIREMALDLGEIPETEFYDQFPEKLREAMERELARCMVISSEASVSLRTSASQYALQMLCDFLLRGTLPWDAVRFYGGLRNLFRTVLEKSAAQFRSFLYTYGHYTSLRQRLIRQFRNPDLEKGVELLSPHDGRFVCDYVRSLRERFDESRSPELTPAACREAVWEVVYAFLTDRRGSYFNRKTFVQRMLHELASRFRTSYAQLLKMIVAAIPGYAVKNRSWPEILMILEELQSEQSVIETTRFGNLPEWKELYRTLSGKWKAELAHRGVLPGRERLIAILATESSCRALVNELDEASILRLVPIVIPQESVFVIAYARSLDHSSEQGVLEGKTGGDFQRLKWLLIFPVLLEKRGTAFSRNYFALGVLDRIAARYNLDRAELLAYFSRGQGMPRELADLFRQLYETEYPESERVRKPEPDSLARWITRWEEGDSLTSAETAGLMRLFSHTGFRTEFLRKIGPSGCHRLIGMVNTSESPFIRDYARRLDRSVGRGALEGRSGGDFRSVAWEFIFTIFISQPKSSFDRRTFVSNVLRRTAAHYNLDYADLLFYFYRESGTDNMPHGLNEILSSLVEDERRIFLRNALHCGDAERIRLVRQLSPRDADTVLTLIRLLEQFHEIWTGNDRYSAFRTLVWRLVLIYLLEESCDADRLPETILERLSLACGKDKRLAIRNFNTRLCAEPSAAGIATLKRSLERFGASSDSRLSPSSPLSSVDANQALTMRRTPDDTDPLYIRNAGLVLLSPYLPHLFDRLGLTTQGNFTGREARLRAVFLMQYAVWGCTELPEYESVFHKLLTGWPASDPLPASRDLTDEERTIVDSMLEGAIRNWPRLKNTTADGLREGFLQREGALEMASEPIILRVESKAYDMLLDSLPWKYSPIRFGWMERPIIVEWR